VTAGAPFAAPELVQWSGKNPKSVARKSEQGFANEGFPKLELHQALAAAWEGIPDKLARCIADREFPWREQAGELTTAEPTALGKSVYWASSRRLLLKELVWACAAARQRTHDKLPWWSASGGFPLWEHVWALGLAQDESQHKPEAYYQSSEAWE
jgi:hypothetical protein